MSVCLRCIRVSGLARWAWLLRCPVYCGCRSCSCVFFQRGQTIHTEARRFWGGRRGYLADCVYARHRPSSPRLGAGGSGRYLFRVTFVFSSHSGDEIVCFGRLPSRASDQFSARSVLGIVMPRGNRRQRAVDPARHWLERHHSTGCRCRNLGHHWEPALHGLVAYRTARCGRGALFALSGGHDSVGRGAAARACYAQPDRWHGAGNSCSGDDFSLGWYRGRFFGKFARRSELSRDPKWGNCSFLFQFRNGLEHHSTVPEMTMRLSYGYHWIMLNAQTPERTQILAALERDLATKKDQLNLLISMFHELPRMSRSYIVPVFRSTRREIATLRRQIRTLRRY